MWGGVLVMVVVAVVRGGRGEAMKMVISTLRHSLCISYYSETFVYISLLNPFSYSKREILLLCLFYKTHGITPLLHQRLGFTPRHAFIDTISQAPSPQYFLELEITLTLWIWIPSSVKWHNGKKTISNGSFRSNALWSTNLWHLTNHLCHGGRKALCKS